MWRRRAEWGFRDFMVYRGWHRLVLLWQPCRRGIGAGRASRGAGTAWYFAAGRRGPGPGAARAAPVIDGAVHWRGDSAAAAGVAVVLACGLHSLLWWQFRAWNGSTAYFKPGVDAAAGCCVVFGQVRLAYGQGVRTEPGGYESVGWVRAVWDCAAGGGTGFHEISGDCVLGLVRCRRRRQVHLRRPVLRGWC